MVVSANGAPLSLLPDVRAAIRSVDPTIPISDVRTMTDRLSHAAATQRFRAALISTLGVLALLLATIGIYGVVASAVVRRTREIGVRMALGEESSRVRRRVVTEAIGMAGAGIAVGVAGAVVAGRWMATFLVGVSPTDVRMLIGAAVMLVFMTIVAAYVPARRASEVDPMVALRSE